METSSTASRSNRITKGEMNSSGGQWARHVVDRVLEIFPNQERYTVAAGGSPSGSVHFGNMRDIMTTLFVYEEIKSRGLNGRFIYSWDDFDRFRKVPKSLDASFAEHIGKPLTAIPDPYGEFSSYAERYERELEASIAKLGIEVEYRRQSELYRSGAYVEEIVRALRRREIIGRQLLDAMSEKAKAKKGIEEQAFLESYYPIAVYSRFTEKDATQVLDYDGAYGVTYFCKITKQTETVDLRTSGCVKLAWKIDWPMRWGYEGVVFEPGGKDHAAPGSSYDTSSQIAQDVYDLEPPVFVGYDFIGLQGLESKMSSSAGGAVTPGQLLDIYTPNLLYWLYKRTPPNRPFNLAFNSEIYRQYDEFDRLKTEEEQAQTLPFRMSVGYGQIVDWDIDRVEPLLKESDTPKSRASIEERIPLAKKWLMTYNRAEQITLIEAPNSAHFEKMSAEELSQVDRLLDALKGAPKSIHEWTTILYSIPKEGANPEQYAALQKGYFKNLYRLLFDRSRGPRLGTYLWAMDPEPIIALLERSSD